MSLIDDNSSRVLTALRRLVQEDEAGTNSRLPTERHLAEQMGVGRRAVRRALEVLETEGLIWRRQGKGTFLGQPPHPAGILAAEIAPETNASEIMEARLCIEPSLAALCARRARSADVTQMRSLAARAAAAIDPDGAELWDGALHRLIARVAGNRPMLTAFAMLDEIRADDTWRAVRERVRTGESVIRSDRQHGEIIKAIEDGDAWTAEAAMRRHLQDLANSLDSATAERMVKARVA